jgi:seryl-tRNA synthetase
MVFFIVTTVKTSNLIQTLCMFILRMIARQDKGFMKCVPPFVVKQQLSTHIPVGLSVYPLIVAR